MNEQQQALFFRQLGAALQSGVGLGQAVRMAAGNMPRRERELWQGVMLNLERGMNLRDGLQPVRSKFSGWAIAVLELAETSGALVQVCRELSASLVEMGDRRRLLQGMVLRTGGMVWSLVMIIYLLLGGGVAQGSFWVTGLVTAIAIVAFTYLAITWQPLQNICRKVPPLRHLFNTQTLINLGYLQLPLDAGLSLAAALEWLHHQFPDPALKPILQRVEPQIQRGTSLTTAIQPYFSLMVIQMIRTGEEAGTLSLSFAQIRQYYQRDFSRQISILKLQILFFSLLSFGFFVALLGADVIQSILQRAEELKG